jgi:hypothetical protein
MKRVYLAGPIDNADDDGRGWRRAIEPWGTDIEWVNPLDEHDQTAGGDEPLPDKDLRLLDRENIDECDGMVVRYELTPSWGTPREMEYVSEYGTGPDIPVVVWTDVPSEDRSPWVTDADAIETSMLAVLGQIQSLV